MAVSGPELVCEECGEDAFAFDGDGGAICEDCLLESNLDLEDKLEIALRGTEKP